LLTIVCLVLVHYRFEDYRKSLLDASSLDDILYCSHASATRINCNATKTFKDICILDCCNRKLLAIFCLWLVHCRFADYRASILDASVLPNILYRSHASATCINWKASKILENDCIVNCYSRALLTIVCLWLMR
jgi:hypothetical protein